MKTISAYNTAAIDNPNTEPIRIAQWIFTSGLTINICDRVWNGSNGSTKNLFDSVLYEPVVLSWGTINLGDIDPVTKSPDIGQMELVLNNNVTIGVTSGFSALFKIHQPHFSTITIYEFFMGASVAGDLIPIYSGRFEDIINSQQSEMVVLFSGNELDMTNRFLYEVVDLVTYPAARLKDVGKMLPQVWGRARKIPFLGVSVGKVTTLAIDIDDAIVTIDITDADDDFPSSGSAVLEDERISYTGKSSGQLTGVTRGKVGTSAAAHSRGIIIQEPLDESAYIIGHAVNVINDVYHADPETGRLIRQLSNLTKYTGQAGDENASYPSKACITFKRFIGFIPSGGIILFNGADTPSGWSDFLGPDGKFIVGAGDLYAVGDTGGNLSVNSNSQSGGSHSGTADDTSGPAWAGSSGMGAGIWPFGDDAPAGAHIHTVDYDYTPAHYQVKLIKADDAETEMPANGVIMRNSNTVPSGLSSIFNADQFLRVGQLEYTTWDPDEKDASITLFDGGLTAEGSIFGWNGGRSLVAQDGGKWYWEYTFDTLPAPSQQFQFGICSAAWNYTADRFGIGAISFGANLYTGDTFRLGAAGPTLGVSFAPGDVFRIALDQDSSPGKLYYGKNNTWLNGGDPVAGTNPFEERADLNTLLFAAYTFNTDQLTKITGGFGPTFAFNLPTGYQARPAAGGAASVPEAVDNITIEDKSVVHYHYDDGRDQATAAGPTLAKEMLRFPGNENDQVRSHDHDGEFSDSTITQNIKRAFLRAYTAAVEFAGIVDAIIMWEGASAPEGWALCDGTGGTPDLRNFFIMLASDATVASTGDNTITAAFVVNTAGQHDHIYTYASAEYRQFWRYIKHVQTAAEADGNHSHTVTDAEAYVPVYYALTFIIRTAAVVSTEKEPDQDALVVADIIGFQDDGAGTYTGTPDAIIERPDHISKHVIIDRVSLSAAEINSASYTASGTQYSTNSYRLAVVLLQRPNPRMLLDRIAHQAKSMQFWEVGEHFLKYIPESESVDKEIDQQRVDLNQLWISWTDRIDIKNTFSAMYNRDWSGLSDNIELAKDIVKASDADSITEFGLLEGDRLSYPYIIDETQAQDVIDWELNDQKNPRILIEMVGSYYYTDLERVDVVKFNITENDFLDAALLGVAQELVWRDRPEPGLTFRDRGTLTWRDRIATRGYRIIEQKRRSDGVIQIKIVEVV